MPRIDTDFAIVFIEILENECNSVLKRKVNDLQSTLERRMYFCSEVNLYEI